MMSQESELEKRHQAWLRRAAEIDAEGLFGDEIGAMPASRLVRGRKALTVSDIRKRLGFPQYGGAAGRITETMVRSGFELRSCRVNGRTNWTWVIPVPTGWARRGWRGEKRVLVPRDPNWKLR
jgi:hypothetical protein